MANRWLCVLCGIIVVLACQGAVVGASPLLLSVDIDRTAKSYAPGVARYGEKITVRASDADYAENLGCAIISDSSTPANTVTLSFCQGQGTKLNATSVSFVWKKPDSLTPPPPASYRVEVRDAEGNTDTLVTGAPPALGPRPLQLTTPAQDSVIYTTPPTAYRPTFQWQNSLATTRIDVYEEGTQNLVWTKAMAAGLLSVLYANGGTVYYSRSQLLTNHTYLWLINTGTNTPVYSEPADPITGGHAVTVKDWQEAHGRFAVYGGWGTTPLPPALPGRLIYGNQTMTPVVTALFTSGIMGFTADPYQRTWLGPEQSDYPDWSPDGSKLLWASPTGLFVDDLAGAPATLVPGTSGQDTQARWTPDGARLVYSHYDASTASYDLWLANADGSDAHPVVSTADKEASPAPSPNGLWIAYQQVDANAVSRVRLVRYDGSEDHELSLTGVAGQDPSYAIASVGEPAWSPDGSRLAVVFQAQSSGLTDLVGLGTVPAAGGPLTPLFLSPFWSCCAVPQAPAWSPDGAAVVFSSGHHKPTLSTYATANAVELWRVNAEGGSESPLRLTNDYSLTRHLSWWGPNTLPGTSGALTREGVTITFSEVTAAGVTQVLLREQSPAPAPAGYEFVGAPYELRTSASSAGPIAVEVDSAAFGLAPGADLSRYHLLRWDGAAWADLTTASTTPDRLRGETGSLGLFIVALSLAPTADFAAAFGDPVAPVTVSFTDTSTGGPTTWSWDFGDGGASALQHPTHDYTAAGTYTVSLTASNAGGADTCTKPDLLTVTVPPPTAAFTAAPVRGNAPLTVTFTDGSSGGPTTWSWDFGDGGTSSAPSPEHTYDTVGIYTVALTVANAGGATTEITVDCISVLPPPPTPAFTADVTAGLVPLTVQFADQTTGSPTAWSWDFGDGTSSQQQQPTHHYATVGLYTVSLTASNAGGAATETKMGYITVNPPPPVAAFSASPTTGPIPLTVQFDDASTGAPTSWTWAFGDGGGSTARTPSHTYAAAGAYTVTLTVANAGGNHTLTKVGFVVATVPPPVADFSAAPSQGTAPLTVQFTDSSTGTPTSWLWDFGDGFTSAAQHPSHLYAAAGTYTVSLTASNSGGSNTVTGADAIVVSEGWQFLGLSPDPDSVFKKKPSVTVSFTLLSSNGTPVTNADAKLLIAPVTNGLEGAYVPAPNSSGSGNSFSYSRKGYSFDLATRNLSSGVWSLRITVNGAAQSTFRITLAK